KYTFPAHFQLVAAMNPCKCGFYPDRSRCHCQPGEVSRYLRKISRPLLDRIDICVEIPRVEYRDLSQPEENESSEAIRRRVEAAQWIQSERYRDCPWQFNAQLRTSAIRHFCPLGSAERRIMERAFERMSLSARAYHRIIKVARTIADLEGEERIRETHFLEAIGYRSLDQRFWEVS
ncbi:MAG: ATP-binding protein, partial [Lachnospiraceae bacterium]|nr:ATP-binding protein [Lachnospiraceae bacterium]